MILPIKLIIIVDEYLDNHNILILNKSINKEIIYSNNSEYWKSKYLEKARQLNIYNIALNTSESNFNSKYEYCRLIKLSEIIKCCEICVSFSFGYMERFGFNKRFVDGYFDEYNDKYFKLLIKFNFPYCSFKKSKLKQIKEFNSNLVKFNLEEVKHEGNCNECLKKKYGNYLEYMINKILKNNNQN